MGKAAIENLKSPVTEALQLRFDVILTFAYFRLGEPETKAIFQGVKDRIEAYRQDLKLSQSLMWEIAQAQMLCGVIDTFLLQDLPDAEKNTLAALSTFKKLGNQTYILRCLSNLGTILCSQERYTESVKVSEKILALGNVIGPEDYYLIASEYVNIVDTLTRLKKYSLASENVHSGIKFCEQKDEMGAYTMLLINGAQVECELGNIAQAEQWLVKAESKMGPSKPLLDDALLHSTWAYIYQKRGDEKRKVEEINEVLDRFHKGEDAQIDEIIDRMYHLRDQPTGN
jgi:tetratricopeptide (TPR) repeat protein